MKKALRLSVKLSPHLETDVYTPAVTGKCDEITPVATFLIKYTAFFVSAVRRMCGNCANMSRIRGRAHWMRCMQSLYLTKEKW